jgi:hypothetical protein
MGIKSFNVLFILIVAMLAVASVSAATYNSVKDIPAVCHGGVIIGDTTSGTCRTVSCLGSFGSLQVFACDKPDVGTKTYFEMYKRSSSGVTPSICIDTACIQLNGYAKSSNYPIIQEDNSTNTSEPPVNTTQPPVNNTNSTTQPPSNSSNSTNQQCSSDVRTIPATCTGGDITSDTSSGNCRTVICGQTKVLACNKPDSGVKTYFEMYRQAGSGAERICLGETCIQSEGYKKSSNYPVCFSNSTQPVNNTQPPVVNITTCYNSSQFIPATCDGGSITWDMWNGCRRVYCDGAPVMLACDGAGYFNMMKENNDVKICLGSACIQRDVIKKVDLPLCMSGPTVPQGSLPTTNQTPPSSGFACSSTLQNIIPVCHGGNLTLNELSGHCRTAACSGDNGDSVQVLACDKPDDTQLKDYVEIYKQSQVGSSVDICIAGTCIADSGYARVNYPYCWNMTSGQTISTG